MPISRDLPSTLERSPKKAQETFAKAYDSAVDTYGEGERARRTAYSALKHSFEKLGDHWEPKQRKGPSDKQAARGRPDRPLPTGAGVDTNASKQHLLEVAGTLNVRGRTRMTKPELVREIQKANDRSSAAARRKRTGR